MPATWRRPTIEVELHLDAKATLEGKMVFAAELVYAGAFRLENFPQNMLHPAVLIECPRMLFPFARQILADATRNGGFPPLMLDPIDFAGMYQKRMQQAARGPGLKPRSCIQSALSPRLGDEGSMGCARSVSDQARRQGAAARYHCCRTRRREAAVRRPQRRATSAVWRPPISSR